MSENPDYKDLFIRVIEKTKQFSHIVVSSDNQQDRKSVV